MIDLVVEIKAFVLHATYALSLRFYVDTGLTFGSDKRRRSPFPPWLGRLPAAALLAPI